MMPSLQDYLTSYMKENLFSLVNDWSSNTGIQQINAVCAHIFDVNRSNKMEIKFYDMCTTSGEDWSKAETLFNAIDSTFVKDDLSWTHCVSVGLDNTNGNMGNRNSVKSRVRQKNASCFIAGCSCHLAHIPAKKGGSAYSQTSKCDIEDHMVDMYYYFKGSTRRKGSLTEVLDFSGMVWESLGKYVTTRWLSLEQCADKEVKKVPALHSMVMTRDARTGQQDNGRNGDEDEEPIMRGKRLEKAVSDPMTEVDIAFYVSALSLFTHYNLFLQRADHLAHKVKPMTDALARKIGMRVLIPDVVDEITITTIEDEEQYLPLSTGFLGMCTLSTV